MKLNKINLEFVFLLFLSAFQQPLRPGAFGLGAKGCWARVAGVDVGSA